MRRLLRVIALAVAALVGVVLIALAVVFGISEKSLRATYQIDAEPITLPTDAASLERGRHLATAVAMCAACHSPNMQQPTFAGSVFLDIPPGRFVASNLTGGAGGIGGSYSEADWVRAVRHGVRPDGSPLLFMPSANFYHLSDADLGAILAYIKSQPPVDTQLPASEMRLLGRVLVSIDRYKLPAEAVEHSAPRVEMALPGRTVEYGRYLTTVSTCRDCHGMNLSGGPIDEPGAPPAPNLTPGGELNGWTEADFIKALREGVKPSGAHLRAPMPVEITRLMTDDELGAIYRYLQSLPTLPYNAK